MASLASLASTAAGEDGRMGGCEELDHDDHVTADTHRIASPRRASPLHAAVVSRARDAGAAMASRNPSLAGSRPPSRSVSAHSLLPRRASPVVELSPAEKEKEALIAAACRDGQRAALVQLATSTSGLLSDRLRRTACRLPAAAPPRRHHHAQLTSAGPLLLGCSEQDTASTPWEKLPAHKDEHQVGLDVNRAFVYYPKHESDKQLDRRKEQLSDVILDVLRRHPALCYFQGYHDIVQVFLLVLGPHDAPAAVARLSLLRIRDFMLSTLEPAISQLELLRPIFRAADPELFSHMPKSQPSFALAGTITMFAHNIQDYRDITRLFDFFLAHDAAMPIYLFAAVVLSRREELLEIDHEDEDILYVMLGKLPQPFDVEFHIARTLELYERLPPASLASWEWWRLSASSVLKTSSTVNHLHRLTLEDGERLFLLQEKDVRRQQALRKAGQNVLYLRRRLWFYRKYGYAGFAVIVGVYAFWLGGRSLGATHPLFGTLGAFLGKLTGNY